MRRPVLLAAVLAALLPAAPASAQEPSPSATAKPSCGYVEFGIDREQVRSGETVTVTATRHAQHAGGGLDARLARRLPEPSAVVRSDTGTATVVTWTLRLGESHVLLADYGVREPESCYPLGRPSGRSFDVHVEPVLTLAATRHAVRDYAFTGRVLPAREQVVSLYRHDGARRVLTAQSRVQRDGTYRIHRRFTGSGRFGFSVAVAASSAHLAGSSPVRPTVVH